MISVAHGRLAAYSVLAQALKTIVVQGTPVSRGAPTAHWDRNTQGGSGSGADPGGDYGGDVQISYYA